MNVSEFVLNIILRGSTGILNVATGETVSFRDVAELVTSVKNTPTAFRERIGGMPHDGLRTFDSSQTREAFPNFRYNKTNDGISAFTTLFCDNH